MTGPSRRRSRVSSEQRRQAESWLRRTGRPTTAAAIETLAPHVKLDGRPELVEVQAFARLVRLGQVPTTAAVRGEMVALQAHEVRRRRLKEVTRSAMADLPRAGSVAARYVQEYRHETGRGPSWLKVGRHAGWPRETVQALMPRLRDAGWLRYDDQPGSLRPGPLLEVDEPTC